MARPGSPNSRVCRSNIGSCTAVIPADSGALIADDRRRCERHARASRPPDVAEGRAFGKDECTDRRATGYIQQLWIAALMAP
jgi:hypothetical protein